MENFIPRKHQSTALTILCIAVVALIVILVYQYYTNSQSTQQPSQQQSHQHPNNPSQQSQQQNHSTNPNNPLEKETALNKPTLVLFWGDWCGYSTQMKPEWDKAAAILNSGGVIDAIDYDDKSGADIVNKAKTNLQNFRGFPDIRLFPQGFDGFNTPSPSQQFLVNHPNERTTDNILKFAYENIQ